MRPLSSVLKPHQLEAAHPRFSSVVIFFTLARAECIAFTFRIKKIFVDSFVGGGYTIQIDFYLHKFTYIRLIFKNN